jgi:predicted GNAT superfamily acetyltransferase
VAAQDLTGSEAATPRSLTLRPITDADRTFVLELNAESVHFLAPMDDEHLGYLLEEATFAEIAERAGQRVGFVLLFASGTGYDGLNYAWFTDRYDDFLYLDRIVVSSAHRRAGHASAIYDLVEARHPRIALEVNTVPPNLASLEFHHGRGYRPVGERSSADGSYVVEMLIKDRGEAPGSTPRSAP